MTEMRIVEPPDLGVLLGRDHRAASAARRRAGPVMDQRGVADEAAATPTARAARRAEGSERDGSSIGGLRAVARV
jgi:hypothetical protein